MNCVVNIRLDRADGTSRAPGLKERLVEEAVAAGVSVTTVVLRALAERYRVSLAVSARRSRSPSTAAPVLNVTLPAELYRHLALAASAHGRPGHSAADELLDVLCERYTVAA